MLLIIHSTSAHQSFTPFDNYFCSAILIVIPFRWQTIPIASFAYPQLAIDIVDNYVAMETALSEVHGARSVVEKLRGVKKFYDFSHSLVILAESYAGGQQRQ